MTQEKMIRYLLFQQMLVNPLPWRVERDWTYEVTASNGAIIAKCQTHDEAEEIVQAAEKIKKELGSIDDWPVSEMQENLRKLRDQHHEDRCNCSFNISENLPVSCVMPKGHQGPHKSI